MCILCSKNRSTVPHTLTTTIAAYPQSTPTTTTTTTTNPSIQLHPLPFFFYIHSFLSPPIHSFFPFFPLFSLSRLSPLLQINRTTEPPNHRIKKYPHTVPYSTRLYPYSSTHTRPDTAFLFPHTIPAIPPHPLPPNNHSTTPISTILSHLSHHSHQNSTIHAILPPSSRHSSLFTLPSVSLPIPPPTPL